MARFVTIARYRLPASGAETRKMYQETLDFFAKWEPPEGTTMLDLLPAADLRTVIGVWEGTHEAIAVAVAQFIGWLDVEVIPIGSVEDIIASMVKGGLITAPGS